MRHRIALAGHQRFERMTKRIQTRASSDVARLRHRQRRIEQGHARDYFAIAAGHFLVGFHVGDQRVTLAFTAGSGGGWNSNERQEWFGR